MLALGIVLAWVIPANEPSRLLGEGHFALDAGGDLLLVALLQWSPTLPRSGAHRPRLHHPREDHAEGVHHCRGLGFAAIFAFSLIGVHARLNGIPLSSNVPAAVARGLGYAGFFAMAVVMISSAASTLDSTFSSLSKSVARELPLLAGARLHRGR